MPGKGAWKRTLLAFVIVGVAAVGCGKGEAEGDKGNSAQADSTKTDSTKTAGKDKKKVEEGVPVKVHAVSPGEISDYIQHTSTIEAEESVDVYAQATGLVEQVLAEEGDRVKAGQALLQLVDDDLRLSTEEARVNYQKLNSKFDRAKGLFERNLLSKEDFEEQKFTVEEARLRWERARLALAHATVRSPVDGVVATRTVKLGDRISVSNKLFSLVDMQNLVAYVHVPGRDAGNITTGQPARITTDFLPGSTFRANVLRVSPVVDPSSGTFKVTLALQKQQNGLRPGMFVTAHIVTATHDEALLVPKRAVVYDDGLPHVFVVQDSTAHRRRLHVGFEDSENLEVLDGTDRGDLIVVVGQNGLKDQAKVRIIEGAGLRIPKPDSTSNAEHAS